MARKSVTISLAEAHIRRAQEQIKLDVEYIRIKRHEHQYHKLALQHIAFAVDTIRYYSKYPDMLEVDLGIPDEIMAELILEGYL